MAGVRKRGCDHAQTDAQYLMRRWARGIDRSREELARQAGPVGKVLEAAGRHRSRAEARWLCLDRPDAGAASSKWLCIGTPAQADSPLPGPADIAAVGVIIIGLVDAGLLNGYLLDTLGGWLFSKAQTTCLLLNHALNHAKTSTKLALVGATGDISRQRLMRGEQRKSVSTGAEKRSVRDGLSIMKNSNVTSICQAINDAFSDTPYPGDTNIVDDMRGEGTIVAETFRGKHWREVSPETLFFYRNSIPFLSADAYRFYLPAFMLASLDNQDVLEFVLYSLDPKSNIDETAFFRRAGRLNEPEKMVVKLFLEFIKDKYSRDYPQEPSSALRHFWG